MESSDILANSHTINAELAWLKLVIDTRFKLYFKKYCDYEDINEIEQPDITKDQSYYSQFIIEHGLNNLDRLILILTLTPHIQPHILDYFFLRNSSYDRDFTEFGGTKAKNHSGFLPTGETILFLLTGDNLFERIRVQTYLLHESILFRNKIIQIGISSIEEPFLSAPIFLTPDYVSYLTTGELSKPNFSPDFPASLVYTPMDWDDLVVDYQIMSEIMEIKAWIDNANNILNDPHLKKYLKPGYRALFYGPPGTGKTLTASLLGRSTNLDVYKVDLSMLVSKYIGETEKNLGRVFDMAQNRQWILFFDEADALFSKRTETASSNDRYANQEVAYLLQRIEEFPGVIILATNLKDNIDSAFIRRFQSIIYFPTPNINKRTKLWKQAFNGSYELHKDINFELLAEKYDISGGVIINVLRYCILSAMQHKRAIRQDDILTGLKKEFYKEGKTLEQVEKETERKN
ncbi:ATP-binding protein [Hymenobacter sp. GOD-10R]|uniref:ATP-binding protein n=1 Tax=Hymenobacter sp. GOD-10R TaxID=3093922 RepID=UPI002D792130|nr:ATP-binding protein [Hymenobacter sp. GOD-10R]WRQ31283.1 ATP-binding protein [Hymenobacter sp. GOD-10R]